MLTTDYSQMIDRADRIVTTLGRSDPNIADDTAITLRTGAFT